MTTFLNCSLLVKGALVGTDILNPLDRVVVFQYNPDRMARRLEAASGDGDRGEAQRLTGPGKETITLNIETDATDQLEQVNPLAVTIRIFPTLSALEMRLYPKSAGMIAKSV